MLTAYEKETCINFSEESDEVTITSYNKRYIREALKAREEFPDSTTLIKNKDGSIIFTGSKKWVSFRVPKKRKAISEEQRAKLTERLAEARKAKNQSGLS